MANDKDLIIGIRTEGADAAAAEIRKVDAAEKQLDQSLVKITDTARTDTSVRKKQIAEFAAWQQARMAANKEAGVSALAVSASNEIVEKSSREASSAALSLAATEEAAAIRRGIAAREASIAIEAEAKRVVAARLKEEAASLKGSKNLGLQALKSLTPESRQLSAVTNIATNPDTLKAFGSVAAPAAVAAVGVWIVKSTANAVEKLNDLKKAAKDTGQTLDGDFLIHAEAAIEGFGPFTRMIDKAKEGVKSLWKTLKDPIGELSGINQVNEKMEESATLLEKLKLKQRERSASFAEMNQKILDSELKLQAARAALEQGREERAGVSAAQSAANEIARTIKRNAIENQKIIAAIAEAKRIEQDALADMRNMKLDEKARQAASKTAEAAFKSIGDLETQLTTKIQTDGLALQNSIEDALDKAKTNAENKLTANAEKLKSMIESVIEEKGSDSQYATKDALQRVQKLFEVDGKITMEEAEKLSSAAQQFWSSTDTVQLGMRDSVSKLMASDQKALDAYKALKDQVATSTENQSQAVEAAATSKAALTEIGKNVEITNTKAGEVKAAVTDQRETTIKAIKGIAPIPAETAKVTAAVEQVKGAIDEQGNAIIKALSSVTSGMGQVTSRINEQQQQINQIFARLR